ncbi:hypothetical protein B0H16DRAFT_1736406 [Mycena metata]|uniref:Uncharacterized protein n=1 Tax=Mycena metata TaxID=1033252 RepID=A0AAD7HNK2_9AGAR|nr:hypothetical protein B0H16DRAFT_1736406 [Mycena metata]
MDFMAKLRAAAAQMAQAQAQAPYAPNSFSTPSSTLPPAATGPISSSATSIPSATLAARVASSSSSSASSSRALPSFAVPHTSLRYGSSSLSQSSTSAIPSTLRTPASSSTAAVLSTRASSVLGASSTRAVPATPVFQPPFRYTSLLNPSSSSKQAGAPSSSSKPADTIFIPYTPNAAKPVKKKAKKNKGKSDENGVASTSSAKKRKASNGAQMDSEPRPKRAKLADEAPAMVSMDDDNEDSVVVKQKSGPARYTKGQRRAKADQVLETRRVRREGKEKTGLVLSDHDKKIAVDYLAQELQSLLEQQQDVTAAITIANADSTSVIAAVDAVRRVRQQLAHSPIPLLDTHLLNFLDAYAQDPLHLKMEDWVDSGILVEDLGQIEPNGIARSYIRVAEIPSDHVLNIIGGKMYSRPADIPWIALVLWAHGIPQDQVLEAVKSAIEYYGLDFEALREPLRRLFTSRHSFSSHPSSLTLTNPGITIENTPLARLQQELLAKGHSRFHHLSKHLTWKAYHLPTADVAAPGGVLDFRRNPDIGRREALTVNAGRGLVLNTTPGVSAPFVSLAGTEKEQASGVGKEKVPFSAGLFATWRARARRTSYTHASPTPFVQTCATPRSGCPFPETKSATSIMYEARVVRPFVLAKEPTLALANIHDVLRCVSGPLLVFNDIYHGIGSLPFLVFIVTGSLTYAAYCIYQKYHIALHYARAALNNIWHSVQVPRSDVVSKNASPDRTCMRPPRSPLHPRLGNDLEDVGILSTSDPGPSSGSLLHFRDTVFTKAIPSSTISSVPIDPNSTHIPPVHPPINRNTLKELDLDVIIRNPPLCHDLLFDPGLQLRSSSAPRPRVKACPRRCLHDRHALQNIVEGGRDIAVGAGQGAAGVARGVAARDSDRAAGPVRSAAAAGVDVDVASVSATRAAECMELGCLPPEMANDWILASATAKSAADPYFLEARAIYTQVRGCETLATVATRT